MASTLRLSEIQTACKEIGFSVQARGFSPHHILYIESAGKLLGIELARQFNCSCSGLCAARQGWGFKKLLAPLFQFLPQWLAHEVRRIELNSNFHNRHTERHVTLNEPLPLYTKRILLVDDAVDTGHSLQSAVTYLNKMGFSRRDILTAVINVTSSSPVFMPDVYLHKELLTFPWSPGSQDWKAYQQRIKQIS